MTNQKIDRAHRVATRGLGVPTLKCRFGESVGQVGFSNLGDTCHVR